MDNSNLPDISLVCKALKIVYETVGMNAAMKNLRKQTEETKVLKNKIEKLQERLANYDEKVSTIRDIYFCGRCDDIFNTRQDAINQCLECLGDFCDDCYITCQECGISNCKTCIATCTECGIPHCHMHITTANGFLYCTKCIKDVKLKI
jgi:hypothetical protein